MKHSVMKAIVFTRYGSPDDLELTEVAKPTPKENELLIRVHASSVNSWDWEYLKGTPYNRKLRLVAAGPNKGLAELRELLEAGNLVPIIDRTYSLSEVPEALRYFGEGRNKGKIIIAVRNQLADST
jgi:NADPH:quinone reductase-like Zn-dependent oxidoreductase